MTIPHQEKTARVEVIAPSSHLNTRSKLGVLNTDLPPEIPPRMKKKGPELPEKPPHLKINKSNTSSKSEFLPSSQTIINSLTDGKMSQITTFAKNDFRRDKLWSSDDSLHVWGTRIKSPGTEREILVAAARGARERPIEKRQREPAKLLTPTSDSSETKDIENGYLQHPFNANDAKSPHKNHSNATKSTKIVPLVNNAVNSRKSRPPFVLIPHDHVDPRNFWNCYPIPYAMWVKNSGIPDHHTSGLVRKGFGRSTIELGSQEHLMASKIRPVSKTQQHESKNIPVKSSKASLTSGASAKPRSNSVTRSGSLTSQGSTSSDSGNETFPKSVLKKHKRENSVSKKTANRPEQKKNVTFNAFATVQLMEE